ncbi:Fibrous sheath-interacting protein 2 [Microtus ochrogaster]|uniref:Fibrous sheath-interacting protein 2 n=1 Tax=Microtus ochrogaster TaxID=79684 RepID=A0A8J6L1E0_MICOH|nr:Fibrous sheath-interacting protein 2 [Microtus ochrogaster]
MSEYHLHADAHGSQKNVSEAMKLALQMFIVCSLRELNKYRQYLTSLKLDFERNYLREQVSYAFKISGLNRR